MEKHAKALSKILGKKVRFVEDVFGEAAKAAIDGSEPGRRPGP